MSGNDKPGSKGAWLDPRSVAQHRFDCEQDIGTATEVFHQLDETPAVARHSIAIVAEHTRLGVAEAVDRLIDIANRVEAAGRTQQRQQACLTSVGVLKLVHQDVVELGLHAPPDLRIFFQEAHGVFFQIVVIQTAGFLFSLTIEGIETCE